MIHFLVFEMSFELDLALHACQMSRSFITARITEVFFFCCQVLTLFMIESSGEIYEFSHRKRKTEIKLTP